MNVIRVILTLLALTVANQAMAAAVRFQKNDKSEISERVSNIVFKTEKAYKCILEGQAVDGGLFTGNTAEVNVTAVSLQSAAELALTPFLVEAPAPGDRVLKVRVEGTVYSVRNINCKPVEQSI